jgi:hypothetical protein
VSEAITTRPPSSRVLPHELPASLRDAGLTNWIREPLDDAVDRRRRIIMPPAAAAMGTPVSAYQGAQLAESRHPDTVFMMGDNPALPSEGLGFDGSPVAHMWRTMIWPNNFL